MKIKNFVNKKLSFLAVTLIVACSINQLSGQEENRDVSGFNSNWGMHMLHTLN